MASRNFFLVLACLLFGLQFGSAQVPTAAPLTRTFEFTRTQNLWTTLDVPVRTYTDAVTTITLRANEVHTTITASDPPATATYTAYAGLEAFAVRAHLADRINLDRVPGPPQCVYPTSSTWSLLPRIAFYCSIVFALVARAHEWLVAGALGAALTYSGLAAIQLSSQVWNQAVFAELDFIPMTGILAGSCIIAVPLMNWSSTIRELGLPKEQKEDSSLSQQKKSLERDEKKEYRSTRTVLVFWGLLVAIGFLSAFVAIQAFIHDADWIKLFIEPIDGGIYCHPPNGTLDMTAGQLTGWKHFWITAEFVEANNCEDPCNNLIGFPLFRSPNELTTLGTASIDLFFEQTNIPPSRASNMHFIIDYWGYLIFLLPFALLQAIMHVVIFWRHTPQKARWKVFLWFSGVTAEQSLSEKWTSETWNLRMRLGFCIATFFYSVSLLILIITPLAFVMNVINTEIFMWYIPQSETNAHVDQWGVFAITIMILIAAIICRLTPSVQLARAGAKLEAKQRYFDDRISHLEGKLKRIPELKTGGPWGKLKAILRFTSEASELEIPDLRDAVKCRYEDVRALLAYELYTWKEFWNHPERKPIPRKKAHLKGVTPPDGIKQWYVDGHQSTRSKYHSAIEEEIRMARRTLRETKARYEEMRETKAHDEAQKRDIEAGQHQGKSTIYTEDSISPISMPVRSFSQASTRTSSPANGSRSSSQNSIPRKPVSKTHLRPDSRSSLVRHYSNSDANREMYELPSDENTPFVSPSSGTPFSQSEPLHATMQQAPASTFQTIYSSAGRPHSPSYFPLQDQESDQYPTEPEASTRSFVDDNRW